MKKRMEVLDALRGVAALIVVAFHAAPYVYGRQLAPSGYLAVDFFFMLSGLVIAEAYGARLVTGLSLGRFFTLRVIRLYPLYILGLFLGLIDWQRDFVNAEPWAVPLQVAVIGMVSGLAMLPSPLAGNLFPLNPPAWSLLFELLINFAYGAFLVRLATPTLIAWIFVSALGLIAVTIMEGAISGGHLWHDFFAGIARVAFSFSVGILIARIGFHKKVTLGFPVACGAMLVLCAVLLARPTGSMRMVFDLLAVGIVFPVLVLAGAASVCPKVVRTTARLLGDTSYGIYVIHVPLLGIFAFAMRSLKIPASLWLPCFGVGIVMLTTVLDRYFDQPARRWLSSATLGQARVKPS